MSVEMLGERFAFHHPDQVDTLLVSQISKSLHVVPVHVIQHVDEEEDSRVLVIKFFDCVTSPILMTSFYLYICGKT